MYIDTILDEIDAYESSMIMMVGSPFSGKTRLAKQLEKELDGYVRVSPDYIKEDLKKELGRDVLTKEIYARVFDTIVKYLDAGVNVIYDAPNDYTYNRKKIMNVVQNHVQHVICLVMTTDLATCLVGLDNADIDMDPKRVEDSYLSIHTRPPHIFEGYDLVMGVGLN